MLAFAIVLMSFNLFRFTENRECEGIKGYPCCDGYFQDQITGQCKSCPPGYFLKNCSTKCSVPYYGEACQSFCHCPNDSCHFATGCPHRIYTYTGYQPRGSTKENTSRQTSKLTVSNRTEVHVFSADINDNDVTQMTYLPREIDLFKNDLFNHLVKILGSFLGLLFIVLTILFIYYIYLKYFQKTTNEGEINEHQRGGGQIINF